MKTSATIKLSITFLAKRFAVLSILFSAACLFFGCSHNNYRKAGVDRIDNIQTVLTPWQIPQKWHDNNIKAKRLLIFSSDNYLEKPPITYTEWTENPPSLSNIGFVKKAFMEGMFDDIIWITPFDSSSSSYKKALYPFLGKKEIEDFSKSNDILKGTVSEVPIRFCSIQHLPESDEPTVIYVDPSYFNSQYLMAASEIEILSPDDMVRELAKKNISLEMVTALSFKQYRGHLLKQTGQILMNQFLSILENPALPDNREYNDLFNAFRHSAKKQFELAITELNNIRANSSDRVLLELMIFVQQGKAKKSAETFSKLCEIIPDYTSMESSIGDYLFHRNKKEIARTFYQQLHKKNSQPVVIKGKSNVPFNTLLITIDTLRADALGCYGNNNIKTPAIDQLAKEGTMFRSAYCQIPQTGPSHASILSGRFPASLSMLDNGTRLSANIPVLPEILVKKGVATGAIVSAYPLDASLSGLDRGFQYYDDKLTVFRYGEKVEKTATQVTDSAIKWLSNLENNKPFFLWLHYYDPHGPYEPPEEFTNFYSNSSSIFDNISFPLTAQIPKYQNIDNRTDLLFYQRKYAAEISYVDSEIARIVKYINQLETTKETIFILTADHGESMGENNYAFDHGHNLYQGSVRVPLIFKGPQIVKNQSIAEVVESVDIMPTIVELLQIPLPVETEGKKLTTLLKGERKQNDLSRAYLTTGNVYLRDPSAEHSIAIVTNQHKFVKMLDGSSSSLYNLNENQEKQISIINSPEISAKELEKELLLWWGKTGNNNSKLPELSENERKKLNSLGYIGK